MGAFLFRHRVFVMIGAVFVAAALIVVCARAEVPALAPLVKAHPEWRRAILVVTGLMCWLGFLLRVLGEMRLGDVVWKQGETPSLVDDAIFSHTRNPLYLGAGIFYVGLVALWAPLVVSLGLGVAFFAMVNAVVRHEETLLSQTLGAPYVDYLTRVPRWGWRFSGKAAMSSSGVARAILPNLALFSFGMFRVGVALGGPEKLLGAINIVLVLTWLVVIAVKRVRGLQSGTSG